MLYQQPSAVWKTIVDIEGIQVIAPNCVGIELISGDKIMRVGAKWKDIRHHKGEDIPLLKTVISMTENDPFFDVHISIRFKETQVTNTATLSVRPVEDNEVQSKPKSVLVGTSAVQATGWFWRTYMTLFGCCIKPETDKIFQSELDGYRIATSYLERWRSCNLMDRVNNI